MNKLLALALASTVLVTVSASAATTCPQTGSTKTMQKCISKQVDKAKQDFIRHFNKLVGQSSGAGAGFSSAPTPRTARPSQPAIQPREQSSPAGQQQPPIHIHYD